MKTNKYIVLIVMTSLWFSCTKEIPFPDVEDSPLMVVNSLFSPKDGITVHVSETCHITVKDCALKSLPTAEVKLLDANGTVLSVLDHTNDGIYSTGNIDIEHGKNYQLEVNDMTSTLQSITTSSYVPMPVTARLLGIEEAEVGGRVTWGFDVEIEDDPDVENYYVLEGSFDFVGGKHDDYISEINGYIEPHFGHFTDDPNAENSLLFTSIDFQDLALRGVYLSDKNFNGQKYVTRVGIIDEDMYRFGNAENTTPEKIIGNILVKSVSKEMFNYMVSLEEFRLIEANPFSDPIQLYTNIKDGVGIFGGFTEETFKMELPTSEYWYGGFDIQNDGCTAPCTVTFTAIGGSKLNYFWDFGDGSTSTDQVVEHTYETSREYSGVLQANGRNSGHFSDFNVIIK